MTKTNNWFEVSRTGLRALQAGKPKHHIVRELIQNAWDENTQNCEVELIHDGRIAQIKVVDDSPEGFRDLADIYTLFKETYKRPDPKKRGRFNVGEKQAIAVAEKAKITTTKGTIIFEKKERKKTSEKRKAGSEITLWVKMSKKEFEEIGETLSNYIPPEKIFFTINKKIFGCPTPEKKIETHLKTEIEENGVMKQVQRNTEIWIYPKEKEKTFLYEMGIPVCDIECLYNINVQQRVPLSMDRETVPVSYLKDIYAEVLNETHEKITSEMSSELWVREATQSSRIKPMAVKEVITKRFGEKSCVANPFDLNSIDEAISAGYRVITGNEMSKEEWSKIRDAKALSSSSELFGSSVASSKPYEPNDNMKKTATLAKKIAKRCLNIDILIHFSSWDGVAAQYGSKILTFNVKSLGKHFFNPPFSESVLNLIIHELSHEGGNHTEKGYHETITKIAAKLIFIILEEPDFFN